MCGGRLRELRLVGLSKITSHAFYSLRTNASLTSVTIADCPGVDNHIAMAIPPSVHTLSLACHGVTSLVANWLPPIKCLNLVGSRLQRSEMSRSLLKPPRGCDLDVTLCVSCDHPADWASMTQCERCTLLGCTFRCKSVAMELASLSDSAQLWECSPCSTTFGCGGCGKEALCLDCEYRPRCVSCFEHFCTACPELRSCDSCDNASCSTCATVTCSLCPFSVCLQCAEDGEGPYLCDFCGEVRHCDNCQVMNELHCDGCGLYGCCSHFDEQSRLSRGCSSTSCRGPWHGSEHTPAIRLCKSCTKSGSSVQRDCGLKLCSSPCCSNAICTECAIQCRGAQQGECGEAFCEECVVSVHDLLTPNPHKVQAIERARQMGTPQPSTCGECGLTACPDCSDVLSCSWCG